MKYNRLIKRYHIFLRCFKQNNSLQNGYEDSLELIIIYRKDAMKASQMKTKMIESRYLLSFNIMNLLLKMIFQE
jgi:hypothetical protein